MSTTLISNAPEISKDAPATETDTRIRLVGLGRKEIAQHLTENRIFARAS